MLRLGAIVMSPEHFWAYTVYYDMAKVVAGGGGYCLSPGAMCAYFPAGLPDHSGGVHSYVDIR